MSDIVKVRWSLSIGLAGCRQEDVVEFEREEWEEMDEDEREEALQEIAFQCIEWGYEEVEP